MCSAWDQSASQVQEGADGALALVNLAGSALLRREGQRRASLSRSHSLGSQNSVGCHFSNCLGPHRARQCPPTPVAHSDVCCPSYLVPHPASSSYTRVALVTGANKGISFAFMQDLCWQFWRAVVLMS